MKFIVAAVGLIAVAFFLSNIAPNGRGGNNLNTFVGQMDALVEHLNNDRAGTKEKMLDAISECTPEVLPRKAHELILASHVVILDGLHLSESEQTTFLEDNLLEIGTKADLWLVTQSPEVQDAFLKTITQWQLDPDVVPQCHLPWLRAAKDAA